MMSENVVDIATVNGAVILKRSVAEHFAKGRKAVVIPAEIFGFGEGWYVVVKDPPIQDNYPNVEAMMKAFESLVDSSLDEEVREGDHIRLYTDGDGEDKIWGVVYHIKAPSVSQEAIYKAIRRVYQARPRGVGKKSIDTDE